MRLSLLLTALSVVLGPLAACDDGGGAGAAVDAGTDAVLTDADGAAQADGGQGDTTVSIDTSTPPPDLAVGYRAERITYQPDDGTGDRTLRLTYWYPTADAAGEPPLYGDLIEANAGVFEDAALYTDAGPFPVLVFSHGNNGFAEQSFFLTEAFAKAGFVVVGLDHTGNTFVDLGGPMPLEIFYWRPWDVSAVLDHLDGIAAEHFLHGQLRDSVAVSGHSFGGYTAMAVGGAEWAVDAILALCVAGDVPLNGCDAVEQNEAIFRAGFRDDRVDAIIPMSPGGTFLYTGGIDEIAVPTLLFTGTLDDTTSNAEEGDPTWNQLSPSGPDHIRGDFATAGHFTFSNACELPFGIGAGDGCGDEFVDSAEAHAAINALSEAFLARHLSGDAAPLQQIRDNNVTFSDDLTLFFSGP